MGKNNVFGDVFTNDIAKWFREIGSSKYVMKNFKKSAEIYKATGKFWACFSVEPINNVIIL